MDADGIIAEDVRALLAATRPAVWSALRGKRLFMTGGTGFVGKWLLEAITGANAQVGLDVQVTVLTRDAAGFRRAHPRLAAAPMLAWCEGDVTSFPFPQGQFEYVVHAALPTATHSAASPEQAQTATAGLSRVCEFAGAAGARRLLHVSSGAVYGSTAAGPIGEDTPWSDAAPNAYTAAKRAAETVCANSWPFEVVIARLFSFLGPYLSTAGGSAAAQFTSSAAVGEEVVVRGTGEAVRGFQYPADMARWLLTLLALAPADTVFNVGSEEAVTIRELAARVGAIAGTSHRILGRAVSGLAGSRYVPDTTLARTQLGLQNSFELDVAIRRTLAWRRAAAPSQEPGS